MSDPGVIRYVVTHIDHRGMRTLACAAQGRFTYPTPEAAQRCIDQMLAANSMERLSEFFGLPLEVRPVESWPAHFDPKGVWFD